MPSKPPINWPEVFAWMDATGCGASHAARHFDIPQGTVKAAASHRRAVLAARRTTCPECGADLNDQTGPVVTPGDVERSDGPTDGP